MTPQPRQPRPIHPVHQKQTPHAIAVPRRERPERCRAPRPCVCSRCRDRWLWTIAGDTTARSERRALHEPGAVMGEAIRVACYLWLASVAIWQVYIFVSSGGAQL